MDLEFAQGVVLYFVDCTMFRPLCVKDCAILRLRKTPKTGTTAILTTTPLTSASALYARTYPSCPTSSLRSCWTACAVNLPPKITRKRTRLQVDFSHLFLRHYTPMRRYIASQSKETIHAPNLYHRNRRRHTGWQGTQGRHRPEGSGGKDAQDAWMSANYLKSLPYVDTDRIGIWASAMVASSP